MLNLLLLPIFSILTFPIILVFVFFNAIGRGDKILWLSMIFSILWIAGFYVFTANRTVHVISWQAMLPVLDKSFVKMQVYFIVISLGFYLPLFFWIKDNILLKHLAIIYASSYLFFILSYRWYDSYQFLFLFWIPFAWVYSWIAFIRTDRKHIKIILYCAIGISFIQTFLYKRDFQRTAVDNSWLNQIYTYLDEQNFLQQGAALWYYDIRQSHIFCWQDKDYNILSLLAKPIIADGITQKSSSDTLSFWLIQKSFLFQPKPNEHIEAQIISFCKQRKIRFLIYPTHILHFDSYDLAIERRFESKKDRLTCVIFR